MRKAFRWIALVCLVFCSQVSGAISDADAALPPIYNFSTLASFDTASGTQPYAGVIADANGNLFGTTQFAGTSNTGTVFELAAGSHNLTRLTTFTGECYGKLFFDSNGNLYGTNRTGGTFNFGSVFKVAAGTHQYSTVVSFGGGGNNLAFPYGALIADSNGNLFGTTIGGGNGPNTNGAVFEITGNAESTLASFGLGAAAGSNPQCTLVADSTGNLYGTTRYGGTSNNGTVFKIDATTHAVTYLTNFNGANGAQPVAGLIIDSSSNLYGSTIVGGSSNQGTIFEIANDANHTLSTLANFSGLNGTGGPYAELVADQYGNLFGTTPFGGSKGYGSVFEVTADTHQLNTLYTFNSDGGEPFGSLTIDTNGNLFGTTNLGGANDRGTVFELSPVPEPTTLTLLALGTIALLARRRFVSPSARRARPICPEGLAREWILKFGGGHTLSVCQTAFA